MRECVCVWCWLTLLGLPRSAWEGGMGGGKPKLLPSSFILIEFCCCFFYSMTDNWETAEEWEREREWEKEKRERERQVSLHLPLQLDAWHFNGKPTGKWRLSCCRICIDVVESSEQIRKKREKQKKRGKEIERKKVLESKEKART